MEKIFDIAKDSAKIWGTIAQGIDGNFEELQKDINEISYIDQKNLVDFDNLSKTPGRYYKGTTGVIASGLGDTGGCFDLIKVKPNTQYYLSVKGDLAISSRNDIEVGLVFYRDNIASTGNYISGISASTKMFITPSECQYLGISYTNDRYNLGEIMLNLGTVRGDYEQWYESKKTIIIPKNYISGDQIKDNSIPQSKLIIDEKLNTVCVPQKIYLLSGVNNDIFYEPILQKWLPYRYDVRVITSENGGRDYVKANKRVCTLKDTISSSITLKLYDDHEERYIDTKTTCTGNSGYR